MVVIYDFICDECGNSILEKNMKSHSYVTGHRYFKYIGLTKVQGGV